MRDVKSKKTGRECHLLKVTGIALLTLVMFVNIVGAAPPENITFVTTGSSFSPIITVTGNPTIQWEFGDGSTSNSASPTVNFGSVGRRVNTLVVTPWSAVTKINLGYDGSDEGVTPDPNTIAYLREQNVVSVSGLENVAPYLQVWASSYNPITELDFNDFTALHTIECFYCVSLSTMKLRNVPSLTRLAFERSNISYLDLSEAPSLTDLRGARQGGTTYTINWGNTGSKIWHICTRDNPQITSNYPYNQYPVLEELFNWNDNQTGILHLTSTSLREVLTAKNHYSAAIFSGCFPAGGNGVVDISNNELTSLDISNDPGLLNLNASFNLLNQTTVDGILQTLDSYNTRDGSLDLTGNAAPSTIGTAHANNLTARGWTVRVSSINNQPIANFTSSVTLGTAPLLVQFNDTSTNNPSTRLWNFGDGIYSTGDYPEHTYYSPGNYTVTLGIKNAYGSDSKVVVITVLEQPILPLANFSNNVTEGYVPLSVQFNDSSSNATSWYWDFGDGNNTSEINPVHIYSVAGSYIVNLIVSNANGNNSKTGTIKVLENSSSDSGSNGGSSDGSSDGNSDGGSDGSSTSSSSSGSGGGGGGAGGSPELQSNVEIKELSQAFISSGQNAKFEFPQKVTPVVSVSFYAKKTAGKTTTIVELLKAKSTLVSEPSSNEIYKFINIWVGNSGFATSRNIENATVSFKVEKSWIQDKKIDKSSIILNRYSDKAWNQLPTSLLSEDDKYLYFTAQTPGFSPFAITGKTTGMSVQPANENKMQPELSNDAQTKSNTESTATNAEHTIKQTQNSNTTGKENTGTPIIIIGLVIICLLGLFLWYKR
ncbi:MAG: hypothetical protein QG646_7 [Euryarchaeota archaeon]|nr:hypothetical protein [Euryarchaeota archaeon]